MIEASFKNCNGFQHQDKIKNCLIQSSIYFSSFEIFKNGTIGKLKDFFESQWYFDEITGELIDVPSKSYKENVLKLYPADEFHACCLWLRNMSALDDDDLRNIARIRKHSNMIAYQLSGSKSGRGVSAVTNNLNSLISIQDKIDKWWIEETGVSENPDFQKEDKEVVNWDNVRGNNTFLLSLMVQYLMEVILF